MPSPYIQKGIPMLVKTNDRWTAVHALMNTLLKDKQKYCNYCGKEFEDSLCCDNPQIGRHIDHVKGVINQNKVTRSEAKNAFGANGDKSLRLGLSLPPRFLDDLERAFKATYGEKLIRDPKDLHSFMRKFPAFTTCQKV